MKKKFERKISVLFYTFGNKKIGFGHLFRCISLANFFLKQNYLFSFDFIIDNNQTDTSILKEFADFKFNIYKKIPKSKKNKWNICIVDKLNEKILNLNKLKKLTDILVTIDNKYINNQVDVSFFPLYKPKRKILYGSDYQILNPNFLNERKIRNKIRKKKSGGLSLFISQGGSDAHNLLYKITFLLMNEFYGLNNIKFYVLLSSKYNSKEKNLFYLLKKKSPKKLFCIYKEKNLAKTMNKMDLAISSGGITACELMYLNIPTLLISKEKKELETMSFLSKKKLCINIGYFNQRNIKKLEKKIKELINNRSKRESLQKNCNNFFRINSSNQVCKIILNKFIKRKGLNE